MSISITAISYLHYHWSAISSNVIKTKTFLVAALAIANILFSLLQILKAVLGFAF